VFAVEQNDITGTMSSSMLKHKARPPCPLTHEAILQDSVLRRAGGVISRNVGHSPVSTD
jgi:hypothetical protein